MITNTTLETLRSEIETRLDALLTYDPGGGPVKEADIVHEFQDVDEIYPCVVIEVDTTSSPSRYVGGVDRDIVSFMFSVLTIRPTAARHIITCEDTVKRSGRALIEYLCIKIANDMKKYVPSCSFIDDDVELEINLDFDEREGIYKGAVTYELLL